MDFTTLSPLNDLAYCPISIIVFTLNYARNSSNSLAGINLNNAVNFSISIIECYRPDLYESRRNGQISCHRCLSRNYIFSGDPGIKTVPIFRRVIRHLAANCFSLAYVNNNVIVTFGFECH